MKNFLFLSLLCACVSFAQAQTIVAAVHTADAVIVVDPYAKCAVAPDTSAVQVDLYVVEPHRADTTLAWSVYRAPAGGYVLQARDHYWQVDDLLTIEVFLPAVEWLEPYVNLFSLQNDMEAYSELPVEWPRTLHVDADGFVFGLPDDDSTFGKYVKSEIARYFREKRAYCVVFSKTTVWVRGVNAGTQVAVRRVGDFIESLAPVEDSTQVCLDGPGVYGQFFDAGAGWYAWSLEQMVHYEGQHGFESLTVTRSLPWLEIIGNHYTAEDLVAAPLYERRGGTLCITGTLPTGEYISGYYTSADGWVLMTGDTSARWKPGTFGTKSVGRLGLPTVSNRSLKQFVRRVR